MDGYSITGLGKNLRKNIRAYVGRLYSLVMHVILPFVSAELTNIVSTPNIVTYSLQPDGLLLKLTSQTTSLITFSSSTLKFFMKKEDGEICCSHILRVHQ